MTASQFNSIAIRIAVTIVLAIVLGIMLEIALTATLGNFDFRTDQTSNGGTRVIVSRNLVMVLDQHRRNAQMLSSRIATVVRILASVPKSEGR